MNAGIRFVAAFTFLASLAGCPVDSPNGALDFDSLSPPPGTEPLNTNLTSPSSTLTDFSKLLATGAVSTVVTSGSQAAYIGSDPAGGSSPDQPPPTPGAGTNDNSTGGGASDGDTTGGGTSGGGGGGGDSSGDSSGSGGGARGERVYGANITGTRHEDLDEHGSLTASEVRRIDIGLSDSGELMSIYVPGFVFYPDVHTSVASPGDNQQFQGTVGVGDVATSYSIGVTLRSMQYGDASATATIDLVLSSIGGSLITQGTGVHTLDVTWTDSTMTYSSSTHYEMEYIPAPGVPDEWYFTPECDYDFDGTLRP